jgi:hypothetical protein
MYRFTTIFLINGLLFGGCVFYLYRYDNLLLTIPTSLLAGTIFGAILGVTVYFVGKQLRNTVINFLGLSLLTGVIGLILGNFLVYQIEKLPHGYWRPLITAPEKPVRFIGNSDFTFWGGSIYVETEQGNILSHTCDSVNPCGWTWETALPVPSEENFWRCQPNFEGKGTPPPLFERAVDTYEVNVCGADYTQRLKFALLESGSILVWFRYHNVLMTIWNMVQTSVISPAIS